MKKFAICLMIMLSACSDAPEETQFAEGEIEAEQMLDEDSGEFPEIANHFPSIPVIDNIQNKCNGIDLCENSNNFWIKEQMAVQPWESCQTDEIEVLSKCVNEWTSEKYRWFNTIWITPANIENYGGYRSFSMVRGDVIRDPKTFGKTTWDPNTDVIPKFVIEQVWLDCENKAFHVVNRTQHDSKVLPDLFEKSPDYRNKKDLHYITLGKYEPGLTRIYAGICGKQDFPTAIPTPGMVTNYEFGPFSFLGSSGERYKPDIRTLIKKGAIRTFWVSLGREELINRTGEDGQSRSSRISIDCANDKYLYLVDNFSGDGTLIQSPWKPIQEGTPEFNLRFGDPSKDERNIKIREDNLGRERIDKRLISARNVCFL